jgi:anti-sigma factor RsiW
VSPDHDDIRMLLGAYVLGGLSEADRRLLEAHLPGCADCRDELARSAPLAGLLRRAPDAFGQPAFDRPAFDQPAFDQPAFDQPAFDQPALGRPAFGRPAFEPARPAPQKQSAASLERLLAEARRTSAARRHKVRLQRLILVAAAVIALAGVGVGLLLRPAQQHRPTGPTLAFHAAAGYRIAGNATLVAKPWGTSVSIALADLPAEGPFTLQVSSPSGRTEPACTWTATTTATAAVTGGTSMRLPSIRAITIVDHLGHVLATARPA